MGELNGKESSMDKARMKSFLLTPDFVPGEVVWHKASNQQMVVVKPKSDYALNSDEVSCEYCRDGQYITALFQKTSLKG
jgi:hypothetical protein